MNNKKFSLCSIINILKSLNTQQEIEELAKLLLKFPMVYNTSKFDAGKVITPLNLPLKLDAIFKKQRVSKVPIHL